MSPARAAFTLGQVCDSLSDAHDRGLVHRDIKPENILLCRQGAQHDWVKVVDFGLVALRAELAQNQSTDDAGLEGAVGTPAFMPPEAAAKKPVDHRADLYSLGCVAFWLLTGRMMFELTNPVALICAHLTQTPPKLSEVLDDIDPEFETIVDACLAKVADDRPATAAEVARRLRALDLGEAWSWDAARRWWNEHRPAESLQVELRPSAPVESAKST